MKPFLHFLNAVSVDHIEKGFLVLPADEFGGLIGLDVEFFAELC